MTSRRRRLPPTARRMATGEATPAKADRPFPRSRPFRGPNCADKSSQNCQTVASTRWQRGGASGEATRCVRCPTTATAAAAAVRLCLRRTAERYPDGWRPSKRRWFSWQCCCRERTGRTETARWRPTGAESPLSPTAVSSGSSSSSRSPTPSPPWCWFRSVCSKAAASTPRIRRRNATSDAVCRHAASCVLLRLLLG